MILNLHCLFSQHKLKVSSFELGKPLPAPTLGTLPELPPQTQILVKPVFAYN